MPLEREHERLENGSSPTEQARDERGRGVIVEPPEPDASPAASPAEAGGSNLVAPEPVPPASDASPVAGIADEREGLLARLANAFRGFLRGLRGLPVEIPPGEEGTIAVVEAAAIQRKLEKRLSRAHSKIEETRASLEESKQHLAERDNLLKEAQKEAKRARSEAAEIEAALRKEAEKANVGSRDALDRIQHLQNEMTGREARLAHRDADLEARNRELEDLRRASGERERALAAEIEQARRELQARAAELEGAEQARGQWSAQRDDALRRCDELEQELAKWRFELAGRDDTLAELRAAGSAAEAQARSALDDAQGELEFTKSTLAEKESALQLLLGEVKNQEAESDREREEAGQRQQQLRDEIEDARRKLGEAESAAQTLRSELVEGLPQRAELESLRAKTAHLERELAKKSEEAEMLRQDLVPLRRRAAELEAREKSAADAEAQKAGFQREVQRLAVQVAALRDQFTDAQLKFEKLSAALRDFHAPAVSALQVAMVYAESLAASLAMNETDRSDAQELKQNVESLRQTMQKLSAKLAELGVPHA